MSRSVVVPRRGPSAGVRPSSPGFTLLELLVVIAVIGVIVAIAAPKMNLDAYRVNSGVRAVSSTMSYAQRLSITLQHDVRVAFDQANNRLRIHEDANNDGVMDPTERVTYSNLPDGITFGLGSAAPITYIDGSSGTGTFNFTQQQAGLPVVVFRRDGSASESGGFYLNSVKALATGSTDFVRACEVIRSSGRVIWYTYITGAWTRGS